MEVTSAKAYREKRRQTVILPSGDVFVIRKLGSMALTRLFELMGIADKMKEDMTEEEYTEAVEGARETLSREQTAEVFEIVFVQGILKPKIVMFQSDADDELWIEDVDPRDFEALFVAILEFVGATEEASKERTFLGPEHTG